MKSDEIKIELCKKVTKIVGYTPTGLGDILSILVHPDVIHLTEEFVLEVCVEANSTSA